MPGVAARRFCDAGHQSDQTCNGGNKWSMKGTRQNRDLRGFSIVTDMFCSAQNTATSAVNAYNVFAICTRSASTPFKPGRPLVQSSEQSG
eukprot:3654269-Amphidinium_carterae.1